ncbi:MAG: type I DNA topoisomerase [Gemmatimonadota bacterium]|nr:type I DNA topoisomerase [Gemmatimonadota bacterium]
MATKKKSAAKKAAAKRKAVPAKADGLAATKATAKTAKKPVRKTRATKATKATKATTARAARPEPELPHDEDAARSAAGKSLVIVESPAKAKTIGKYLGSGYAVKATVGHIRDLPVKQIGIDTEHGFEPQYVTIPGKEKTVAELKSAARTAKAVFIATDPDREGEAIAWHVEQQIKSPKGPPIKRALFFEITKDAVAKALQEAKAIDQKKVDAQQARRVLDRLVGYKASPVLWKTVKKGLSAGRVQTVALRLLVEREREIRAFVPREYWTIAAQLEHDGQAFTAKLHHVDGEKPDIPDERAAQRIMGDLKGRSHFDVTDIKRRERRKNPEAPFKTSTLQQEAAKKLGFGSKRTMRLAQNLYEGVELGKSEGSVGLITYMRTDHVRVSDSAAASARTFLADRFGKEFLSDTPRLFPAGKDDATQGAHEGIRPTEPSRSPESVAKFLSPEQLKLYTLIWQRFMASQMAPAVFDTTTVDFDLGRFLFRATGSVVKFKGFLALYRETREEGDSKALEDEQALPAIEPGEHAPVRSIDPTQHFTEPPPRYSEASLVKELEKRGIGRPSTYASIISTLTERHYAELQQRRFFPTPMGESVEKVMVKQFPREFDVGFTAEMEGELDKVEDGRLQWQEVLREFWSPFEKAVGSVDAEALIREAHDLSALETERCPLDGGKLIPKGGFFGPFVACENHPKACKYTRPLKGERVPAQKTDIPCPVCGEMMVVRRSRSGEFLGCSTFPKCRGTKSMPTGVKCPKDGGDIAARRSKKRGKAFYGCENYPKCDFVCWDKPVLEKCPDCGYLGAEAKSTKTRGHYRRCLKCQDEWDVTAPEGSDAEAEAASLAG